MKKLYSKGKIHPSPNPAITNQLSLLPAAILTLTAALSTEDKQVLAYLISCSGGTSNSNFSGHLDTTPKSGGTGSGSGGDHPPQLECSCFRCYMSFWVRWDASPNRQLIHEIIDAYEDGLETQKKKSLKTKKEKRKRVRIVPDVGQKPGSNEPSLVQDAHQGIGGGAGEVAGVEQGGEVGVEKGSVRKLVSFLGERIWGVWGI
ncbi:hypothetical protein RJ639_027543 [Escallonia herrerae]|uniref:Uncharacterized protein n=1 Tax=Escallonia herrerae TaxID=1293975 RepID=A0AA88XHI4_9ASTE|nr:hypothetical protein RJ639_027543 [Escallonia herrerae]